MDQLVKWMERVGLSQSDVARMLGVSRQAVQSWCIGRITPGLYYSLMLDAISHGDVPPTCWLNKKERLALKAVTLGGGDD